MISRVIIRRGSIVLWKYLGYKRHLDRKWGFWATAVPYPNVETVTCHKVTYLKSIKVY